jgi:uncharacterized protein (DUF169 family)
VCEVQDSWKDQAREIVDTMALETKPIAVTFTNEEVEAGKSRRMWVCRALKLAAAGESFVIDAERSACPGGSWHCGLTEPPQAAGRRALQHFLTRGEKLTSSIVSFQRMQGLGSAPPTGMSDRIFIGPMEGAPLRPDIVVFVCNPEQACRLITLDHYWDGKPLHVELTGSLCHGAMGYPAVTGNTNLTLGDWTARRMQKYAPDIVFLTVPYERIANLILAIPECSAGTAEIEIPEAFRSTFQDEEPE